MEEKNGLTIKDLLIRLILIIVFIFLLIWLFPMPDLKPLNNQIFADNVDRMKDVAKSYYTTERLPQNINDSKKMTLRWMLENNLILPLMDSNGKYCNKDKSYVQITKMENEYIIKVNLSCSDKQDYIIEHFGCYDICSDTCKMLETTTNQGYVGYKSTQKINKNSKVTTRRSNKISEYEFVKTVCQDKFDKYVCPTGYYLIGDSCIKNDSKIVTVDAKKNVSNVTSTDTKDAKAVISNSIKTTDANCRNDYLTSTIDAGRTTVTYNAIKKTTTQKITANKVYKYDVKAAIGKETTIDANYITVQNYDIKTADKITTSGVWKYDYTKVSTDGRLAYEKDNERLVYVEAWSEPDCATCGSSTVYHKYYHYVKQSDTTKYSCDAYPGYSLYNKTQCRKATTVSKSCPSGYSPNGNVCSKSTTTYSCSKYGSDYKLNSSAKTCTKTTVTYSCPSGSKKTSDPKYCTREVSSYECPAGTASIGNNKCSKVDYYCPSNTSSKTYTLSGTKCTVKQKVKVCSCPAGTVQSSDKLKCVKTDSKTNYTCSDYPGYTLNKNKCTKTTTYQKVTYSCDSGYILNGTKCIKTVNYNNTKKAEKAYKSICHQEYMWSTSISVKGWSKTGNKR